MRLSWTEPDQDQDKFKNLEPDQDQRNLDNLGPVLTVHGSLLGRCRRLNTISYINTVFIQSENILQKKVNRIRIMNYPKPVVRVSHRTVVQFGKEMKIQSCYYKKAE